jgi:PAS domain S-box-containing protein
MVAATFNLDAEFLVAAFNVARIGICVVDDRGRFIEANPAFCELTGFAREDLVGKPWTLAAPAEIAAQADRFLQAVLSDSSRIPGQWKIRRKDGRQVDALVSFRALARAGGGRCAVLTFSDVTDRIEAELRLKDSETRFRQIAENVREVLWVTDPAKSQMLYISPAYERVWGRGVADLLRNPLSFVDAIHPEDRARVVAAFPKQSRGDYDEVYRIVRPDGGVRWIRDRAFPVMNEKGEVYRVTGIASDITDTKLAEAESQRLQADLERRIAERTEAIRAQSAVLLELAALDKADKRLALEKILAADARTLGIERVSYWSLDGGGAAILCEALYSLGLGATDPAFAGTRLAATDYPTYFSAVLANRPVAANRAQTDAVTREFAEGYLKPLGITSMLDVPVWFQGKVVGVICHEHIGPAREWSGEDISFASSVASMVSLALEESRWQEAVDALTRSEEKYRQVVENANEAIAVVQDGRIRYANPQCMRLSGFSLEELYAKSFLDFVHGDDAQLVLGNYMKRVRGEDAESSYEFRIIDKSGLIHWVHIHAVAMQWEGRPATLNFLADVTERHELQENLARSLAEREGILKTAPVGISFASGRRHRWVNDAFAAMLGYDKSELMGQSSLMHFDDRESWEAFGAEAYPTLAAGRTHVAERLMKRKDGTRFWCEVTGNAVDPADLSRGAIWINVDVTERRRAKEEILRALEKEKELNELKSRFVAMTSHEFRTPLATILSSAELLEQYGARLPAEEKQDLYHSVRAAVERMTKMLDNVLIIGKAEAEMLEFNPAPSDLSAFCESLAEEMRLAAGRRHTLDYSYEGARGAVKADEKLLRHVLVNLISNAFKYSPEGGPVNFRVRVADGAALFEIADHGIGIPPEDQPRLFETFHRARNVGNISGTGLGLAIVKKSLDLHGGSIRYDSAPGRGTRFHVTIQLSEAVSK